MTSFDDQAPTTEQTGSADRLQVLAELLADGDPDSRFAPVSLGQRRLWFVDRLVPGGVDYNVVWPLRLVGGLDVGALVGAVNEVVARHEVLRTRFVAVDGEPVQVIGGVGVVDVPLVDLSGLGVGVRAGEVARWVREAGLRPFDVAVGPLVRWVLLRVSEGEHVLLVSAHHIVFDGWSGSVLLRELSVLYGAFVRGEGSPLPVLPVQFADFAVWERQWLSGGVLEGQLEFWRGYLAGAPAVLDLPSDLPRSVGRGGGGDRERFEFPVGLSVGLGELCRGEGATVFMGLLAGLDVVLGRYAGVEDVVVGTFVANRGAPELEDLIGFFVNTVVVRGDLSGRPSFRGLLGRVRSGVLDVFGHQDVPFDRVVEELHPVRRAGSMPFVQVALVVQNTPAEVGLLGGDVVVESLPTETRTAAFDLSLHLWTTETGALAGFVEYATDLYRRPFAQRLIGHLESVLTQAVADPDRRIDLLSLPASDEHRALLAAATVQPAPAATPAGEPVTAGEPAVHLLHELVAAQVARRPDAVAASCAGERLTYRELDDRAARLARHLRAAGVGPEVLVGICVERSLASVVSVLGVLKAGGAYLPLDPENPAERLAYMLGDAGATTVVATATTRHLVPAGIEPLLVDELLADADADDSEAAEVDAGVTPQNLAYVIYTSGSTGRPKGVAVNHRCAIARVHRPAYAAIDETDVMLHALSLSFDVSVMEVFGALANGAELAVLPGKALPERVGIFLPGARVTVGWLTAALFHAVVDTAGESLSGMRTLIAGGDQLSTSHVEKALGLLDADATLVNGYGPTEAAIFAATHTMRPATGVDGRVPIGGPIPDTELYVFDPHGNLSPVGVPGELYIGGDCLARGYLGRPELTAERFVPHPYATGARLYRTGDVVRWRADHTLEFLGRVDHQVKVRGFRVELGEIEQRLRRCAGVGDAVVVARPDGEDHTLVAYVETAAGAQPPVVGDLLADLREFLPGYMVPNAFVVLDALPLNPNGKVDRAALPDPDGHRPDLGTGYVPPRNPIEETLAGVWADLLGLDRVGAHDDFFDLGGHSLLASRLVARIRRAFDRELPLATFFAAPTVAGLAAALEAMLRADTAGARPPIVPARRPDPLPVSLGQRRLWFVDRLVPGGVDYNVVWPLRLVGGLDVGALVGAVNEVVARHEVLRTRFVAVDGEPVLVFGGVGVVDVPLVDLSGLGVGVRAGEVARWVREAGLRPFDVAVGPLVRWVLLRVSEGEHVLLVSAHHIVFDGWSGSVLLRELSVLYGAFVRGEGSPLPVLPVQFADFAVWERQWLSGGVLEGQLEFWRGYLAGAPAVLDLPSELPRSVGRGGGGDRERFEFPVGLSGGLGELCRGEGATVFMGLLAGLDVVLGRYAGVEDVVVGTFVANRGAPELEDLIGFFVNTVVVRGDLSGRPSFRGLLGRVRSGVLDVFGHQDVPFDRVVEELHPVRRAGSMPFVQVALVVQNTPAEVGLLGGDVVVESLPTETRTAAFDLAFHVYTTESGALAGFVEFATDLYRRSSVQRLVGHLESVLTQAVADPDRRIDLLALPSPAEHHHLTRDVARGAVRDFGTGTPLSRFTRQAALTPDAAAYVDGDRVLTYAELDARSTRLARRLRRLGVGPETPVGVCLGHGLDLPVAALAVWKADGAYLPLDPDNPAERLAYMLDDAGAAAVVTTGALRSRLPGDLAAVVVLDAEDTTDDGATDVDDPAPVSTIDSLAAVIYTSGSTGRPKGVAVTGRSMVNRIAWFADERPFGPGEVGVLKTPIGFVDSLWELLGGLLYGVPTVVVPKDTGRDPKALVRVLAAHGVTRLLLVPSLLRMLLLTVDDLAERLPRLTLWISSGEPLSADLARMFVKTMPGRSLHNLYGAAEGWDSLWPPACGEDELTGAVPVGRPLANVGAHILDRAGQPAPVGVPGELYVGGDCLARGYLGRPDLTAERFLPHPYEPGARLYRTGDLARMLPDGQIELVGRVDQQLKIRGFRVEPGEVERALEALPEVRQAAVVAWTREGAEPELAAYVVADGPADASGVRAALGRTLPSHLVPTSFSFLDALPSTATGKIDRLALPRPVRAPSAEGATPADDAELLLAELWADVLGVERVGVHDDFFDIGGHSLLAAQLVDRIGREIGRELPLRTIFDHSTVHRMGLALRAPHTEPERPLS
ncbi:amino acid adenylation domain-containing protein [Polymorphospora sp. NPDC050346]|uniref:amino acid adenylation domain-containing protein n=1 Tax=Polymorphospora sp. NPDC050346 TaxID=3155780 RepID=UPI0033E0685B